GGTGNDLVLQWANTIAEAWGRNAEGELGNGGTAETWSPELVTPSGVLSRKTVTMLAAGLSHSLAVCCDGTLAAWGYNGSGRLGNNTITVAHVPVRVDDSGVLSGKTVIAIAAGGAHGLALCSDGTVAAWGANGNGQLGNNGMTESHVPVAV